MLAGRPKKDPAVAPKRVRPKTQANDQGIGALVAPKRQPTTPTKRTFLKAILADKRLTADDKRMIEQGAREGLTGEDLTAWILYETVTVKRLYQDGKLEPKDYVVGMNKIASHLAAAVQLGTGRDDAPGGAPSKIEIIVTPPEGGSVQVRAGREVVGDIIDVDGQDGS